MRKLFVVFVVLSIVVFGATSAFAIGRPNIPTGTEAR